MMTDEEPQNRQLSVVSPRGVSATIGKRFSIGSGTAIRESAIIHKDTQREVTVSANSWALNRAPLAYVGRRTATIAEGFERGLQGQFSEMK